MGPSKPAVVPGQRRIVNFEKLRLKEVFVRITFYNTLLIFLIFLSFSGSPVETKGARGVTASGGAGDVSPFARSSAFRTFRASRFSFCLIACFEGCAEVKMRYLVNNAYNTEVVTLFIVLLYPRTQRRKTYY